METKVFRKFNFDEITEYLDQCGPGTCVYLGCDSQVNHSISRGKRFRSATYITVIVIHREGKHGAKIFYEKTQEFDPKPSNIKKPAYRLMNEVYKVADAYLKIAEIDQFIDKDIEIHLDINASKTHGSSCVVNEAIGYIKGVCQVDPKIKPDAWAASFAADRYSK